MGDLPPELLAIVTESTAPQVQALSANQPPTAQNNNSYIDLTLPEESAINLNLALGGSADKPIDLDLDTDMSDLFGDTQLTTQSGGVSSHDDPLEILGQSHDDAVIFAALADTVVKQEPQAISLSDDGQNPEAVPSPGTLLASFSATTATGEQQSESFDLTKLEDFSGDANFGDIFAGSGETFEGENEDIRMSDLLKLSSETTGTS
jgi:hypothetical protein